MKYQIIDTFFAMAAQGDNEAYNDLFDAFKRLMYGMLKKLANKTDFHVKTEDFDSLINDLFVKSLTYYDHTKASYSVFLKYHIVPVFVRFFHIALDKLKFEPCSLDEEIIEGVSYIDAATYDDELTMGDQLTRSEFKFNISSPVRSLKIDERIFRRVLLLTYVGFTKKEISKIVKISESRLKKIYQRLRTHNLIRQFKLETK